MSIANPYLMFLGDAADQLAAKTANGVAKWRPDRRTTILKVYADFKSGTMVSECEAAEQSHFEDWINLAGWPAASIHRVDIICQVGNFWKM